MDEVSYFEKLGESSTCITMAGTPPKVPIFSRWISSRARSASKWCIMMIFPPAARFVTMTEWHPVAWKRGTESKKAGWVLVPVSSSVAGAEARGAAGVEEEEAHQVRAHVAMGAHRTLGPPGGAGRVEDGGVVLRIDGEVGRRGGLVHLSQRERERPFGDGSGAVGRLGDGERGLSVRRGARRPRPPRRDRPAPRGRAGSWSTRSVSTNATLDPESSRP